MNNELKFSLDEYLDRIRNIKESMDHNGIELLIIVDPANMNYLTGYDGWSFYVHQGIIVALDAKEPIWFGREQDLKGAHLTSWLSKDNIIGYPDYYVQSRYTHTMRFVSDLIKKKNWDKRTIGLEYDNYWFSARCYFELTSQLPNATFKDADKIVNWVRIIKSQAEIKYIEQAARITETVMKSAIDLISPGFWEKDVAATVASGQIIGTAEYGGDPTAIFPLIPSAKRTSTAHLTYDSDRRYEAGDVVFLELGAARYHYHAPLSRTVFLGEPPTDLREVADVVVDGLRKTIDFIKPGLTAEEVEAYWRNCLKGKGIEKPSRVGYSFGLAYVPDWGEHTISLRPGDKTVLKPAMTIHLMPGIWLQEYGFECSEPLLITSAGCKQMINFEQKLFVKEL